MDKGSEMSDFLADARMLLAEMKTTMEVIKEQNKSYREGIEKDISFQMERIKAVESRWAVLRGVVISVLILVIGAIVSGGVVIEHYPTEEEVKSEYVTKDQIFRAFGRTIEDRYDVLKDKDILTNEEAKEGESSVKSEVIKEIDPNYRTRSTTETK